MAQGTRYLNISYKWDAAAKTETVYLQQTQDGQTFPPANGHRHLRGRQKGTSQSLDE